MSMAFMVAAASRKRDDKGRYMEAPDRRMEGGYDRHEGNYARMNDQPEMRRQRDSRGRYMEGDEGPHMDGGYEYPEGNYVRYRPWPEPHIPPYLNEPEMRDERNVQPGRERRGSVELEYEPVHMRDRNIVNIRDYQDKRRIGFGENRMHHGEYKGGHMTEGGSHGMDSGEKLSRDKAEKWVRHMYGDDPRSRGEMWTFEDAKKLAEERGLPTDGQDMVDFYVTLNMVYNDYCKVAKEHGVDTEEYYADLAQAWLYDRDGKPPTEKLMAYKKYVVPHGEE